MNQVLGHDVGNALEVREAIDFLTGRRREARLHAVTSALAREMLVLGGLARDHGEAAGPVERALDSGAAAERFARMVAALGGPARSPRAPGPAPRRGAGAAGRHARRRRRRRPGGRAAIGLAVVDAGRRPPAGAEDTIDPAVGLADMQGPGDAVGPDRPLAVVHARSTGRRVAAEAIRRPGVGDGPAGPVGPRCCSASARRGCGRAPARRHPRVAGKAHLVPDPPGSKRLAGHGRARRQPPARGERPRAAPGPPHALRRLPPARPPREPAPGRGGHAGPAARRDHRRDAARDRDA